ncbi:unnamed protein product [Mytilus edulis]|uniref:Uncharacterized protein n=1 Tax=Mytilus edulis TaxID=6550 RepID=A0A8S3TXE2_MYTED|nr:unnamed protein product [Mytilus edulis]
MIKDVNTIFYEAANLSLKQKPTKKSTSKLKQNVKKKPNWLDASLSKLKNNLNDKEKLLQKYPFDPVIRSSFFSLLKHYRKTRKKKIRDFRQDLIDKLDNLKDNNPSQYWALLHELSDTNRENTTSDVSTDAWFSYFKNLNEKDTNASCDYLKDKLKDMEREKIFTELDNLISKAEIEKAINMFQLWMNSIHCYCRLDDQQNKPESFTAKKDESTETQETNILDPPVILVGSHKDKVRLSKGEKVCKDTVQNIYNIKK